MTFTLDPRLAAETVSVCDLTLTRVLLRDDARFDWLILVPPRPALREMHDLPDADQAVLMREISLCARTVQALSGCEKINVGALGNIVSQLHVHVIGRHASDEAWPGPVWGVGERKAHDPQDLEACARAYRQAIGAEMRA